MGYNTVNLYGSSGAAAPGNVTIASEAITIGAITTAPTKGTITSDACYYYIINGVLFAHYIFEQSVVGAAGSGDYLISLPNSYEAHAGWVPPDTDPRVTIGTGFIGNQNDALNSASNNARCSLYSSTQFKVHRQVSNQTQTLSGTIFGLNTFLNLSLNIQVPIVT